MDSKRLRRVSWTEAFTRTCCKTRRRGSNKNKTILRTAQTGRTNKINKTNLNRDIGVNGWTAFNKIWKCLRNWLSFKVSWNHFGKSKSAKLYGR